MGLPVNPDAADLCADAILVARKRQGPLFRNDIATVCRPIIAAAVAKALEAAVPVAPVKHKGTRKELEALFNAICSACGLPIEGMTKPMARTVGIARATIVAVMPNVTPDEIVLRAKQYRKLHPTWELGPMSLAKHWGSLATANSMQSALDEPTGWRDLHGDIFPEAESGATGAYLAKQPWPNISRAHQARICRHMVGVALPST